MQKRIKSLGFVHFILFTIYDKDKDNVYIYIRICNIYTFTLEYYKDVFESIMKSKFIMVLAQLIHSEYSGCNIIDNPVNPV